MNRPIIFSALALLLALSMTACGLFRSGETAHAEETNKEGIEPPIVYPDPDGRVVVCIDAGHGFKDIGCDTDLIDGTEAEVTLDVAVRLKAELERQGAEVILTHDGSAFPSVAAIKDLADRAGIEYIENELIDNEVFSAYERAVYTSAIAKDKGIDFFISLHVNSIEDQPDIDHFEIDYYADNPYSNALGMFCEELSEKLDGETRIYADEYENAFIVTKIGSHPSVLFEMGFATNEANAKNLNSPEWRATLARTLADSIMDWVYSFEEK